MMRRSLAAALLALSASMPVTAANAQQTTDLEAQPERTRDAILRRAEIRSRGRFHGELRLIARGEARVVQTLLYSKVLRRVIARIREKEAENWPASKAGHEDSLAYVAALERAEREARQPVSAKKGDRHRSLLIEFWATESSSAVAFLEPQVEKIDGELFIAGARPLEELQLSRGYITRNMLLIAREHLSLQEDPLRALLLFAD
jgi:hypothetical protein